MLQPATKALAQMLAGRTMASGQLNHARSLLAHAERLIADRIHNRLIPSEREEFFEQLARLRLTLADADAEAQVQAAEEQEEKRPPPPPVAQERLKEMALALSRPERDRPGSPRPADESDQREPTRVPARGSAEVTMPAAAEAGSGSPDQPGGPSSEQEERPALRPLAELPGRLVLSKPAGDRARSVIEPTVRRAPRSSARGVQRTGDVAPNEVPHGEDNPAEESATGSAAGNGAAGEAASEGRAKSTRRSRKTQDGLPEGWVIDDEGYVVPRHD